MASPAEEVPSALTQPEDEEQVVRLKELILEAEADYQSSQESRALKERLHVDTLMLWPQDSVPDLALVVTDRVTHFWIDTRMEYNLSKPLPKLNFPDNPEDIEFDLTEGFDEWDLINDYSSYRDLKWSYLLRTIRDQALIDRYEPDFVSFGGPLAEIMATIYDTGIGWKVWAQKINGLSTHSADCRYCFEWFVIASLGVIFIRKIQTERVKTDHQLKQFQKDSFAILKYLHFLTDKKYDNMSEAVKCFVVNSLELADHKILSLSEIHVVDDSDRIVEAKLLERPNNMDHYLKKKLLRFWTKALVQGAERLVVGTKLSNSLVSVEELTMDKIVKQCAKKWSAKYCFDSLNRFLHFLKQCLNDDNVHELVYNRGEESIQCYRLHESIKKSIAEEFQA